MIKHFVKTGKRIGEKTIWKFFCQISNGLEHMHSKRIMHRGEQRSGLQWKSSSFRRFRYQTSEYLCYCWRNCSIRRFGIRFVGFSSPIDFDHTFVQSRSFFWFANWIYSFNGWNTVRSNLSFREILIVFIGRYYMSPERIDERDLGYNFRSDIWSLACILYEVYSNEKFSCSYWICFRWQYFVRHFLLKI